MQIRDQIALVTGGARGLGLAITQLLIQEGARVVVNYHSSKTQAEALQNQYPDQVFAYQADVTQADQVKALFAASKAISEKPSIPLLIMRWCSLSLMVMSDLKLKI